MPISCKKSLKFAENVFKSCNVVIGGWLVGFNTFSRLHELFHAVIIYHYQVCIRLVMASYAHEDTNTCLSYIIGLYITYCYLIFLLRQEKSRM